MSEHDTSAGDESRPLAERLIDSEMENQHLREHIAALEFEVERLKGEFRDMRKDSRNWLSNKSIALEAKLADAEKEIERLKGDTVGERVGLLAENAVLLGKLADAEKELAQFHNEGLMVYGSKIQVLRRTADKYKAALETVVELGKLKHSGIESAEIARKALANVEGE